MPRIMQEMSATQRYAEFNGGKTIEIAEPWQNLPELVRDGANSFVLALLQEVELVGMDLDSLFIHAGGHLLDELVHSIAGLVPLETEQVAADQLLTDFGEPEWWGKESAKVVEVH